MNITELYFNGSVGVASATGRNNFTKKEVGIIRFVPLNNVKKVGEKVQEADLGFNAYQMVFEKPESIDVLIKHLKALKKKISDFK
jgi:hypothetical protein